MDKWVVAVKLNLRKIVLILADLLIIGITDIVTAWALPMVSGYLGHNYILGYRELFVAIGFNMIFCFLSLWTFGAYSIMWRYAKVRDYTSCLFGVLLGSFISIFVLNAMNFEHIIIPKGYILICAMEEVILICLFRVAFRKAFLSVAKSERKMMKKRVMIIGAGQACKMILKEIENAESDPNNNAKIYNPVCIVDDDIAKQHKKVENVPVVGTTREILEVSKIYEIDVIIFAIPSCREEIRKRIIERCSETKCDIKIVPYLGEVFLENGKDSIMTHVKDINIEDLLGRDPITFDKHDVMNLIKGKVCMVTGAGGSIGSELVRQIVMYDPKLVVMVDIYENSLYEVQQELIMEHGDKAKIVALISSVRDFKKMSIIFNKYKPQIVFHAAAHKHVPLMETSPEEAVKNNIFGTFNVMHLAEFYNVEKFVMISTDKAVNPTNVMGATKRCCEMLAQYMAQQGSKTEFITTRFGNVLGSNGSVIPLFRRQIEAGKPVTVTHPDIIRYFMTIPEAVALVMQAAAIANGGEIFVLDMGSPVKILTLAENLIRMYGKIPYKDVEIKFSGLRPGEKLYEELLMDEEGLTSTSNKKIFIGKQINVDRGKLISELKCLKDYAEANDSEGTVEMLGKIVDTFHHQTNT